MHVAQDLIPWLDTSPQPVALATGRVVRAIGSTEKLDACIKAAEVVARFVALASLASAAATRPAAVEPPVVDDFFGNLSFGTFEHAARVSAGVDWNHPLRSELRQCFKKRNAITGQRLSGFVRLRNELGHAITPADEARARMLIERDNPIGGLIEMLTDLKGILAYPLLVVLGQEHRRGRVLGRFAFFSGEGEPIPQEIELRDPVYEWDVPYLCTDAGLIPLLPGVIYHPRTSDGRRGLYLLDGIMDNVLRYKSVEDGGSINRGDGIRTIMGWLRLPATVPEVSPQHPLLEPIHCLNGNSLYGYLSCASVEQIVVGDREEERVPEVKENRLEPQTLREFELLANRTAVGAAYRDILYCFLSHNAIPDISDGTVRIMPRSDPERVVGTIEVTPDGKLEVIIFESALTLSGTKETEIYELAPNEPADSVVDRIDVLIDSERPKTGDDPA